MRPIIDKQAAEIVWFQSTHSQRVRQIIVFCSLFIEKFQSTHSQRVRLKNLIINTQVILFQSTHSQRVRLQYSNCSIIYPCISIHALTKSATEINFKPHSFNVYFNPRTHKECDPLLLVNVASLTIFQSTHSQRVRLLMHRIYLDTWIISIHALTKSATRWTSWDGNASVISIHALTKSATYRCRRARGYH